MKIKRNRKLIDDAVSSVDPSVLRQATQLSIQISDLLYITSLVQLATRHPGVSGHLRHHGVTFARSVSLHFRSMGLPALAALVDAGNDPRQDM